MTNMQEPESSRTDERGIEGLDERGVVHANRGEKTETERDTGAEPANEGSELRPGGSGRQGDQEQMGQE